jgi:hypothetical protein
MDKMYIGNEKTLMVHAPDCDCVFNMNPLNHVTFDEIYHALRCGYTECGNCLGDNKAKYAELHEIKRNVREAYFSECLCCGVTRGVQRAHIIPRAVGGTDVMPLCPNCHWNYDNGLMTDEELEIVWAWIKENKPHIKNPHTEITTGE